ncbi:hypothetical protein QBC44DRAFT_367651 [Cladorrhinum sp. PSN332]|nr:hypothetical protein QBC44DRAFT_367651 [Cladorrhinum sp. PSN332]
MSSRRMPITLPIIGSPLRLSQSPHTSPIMPTTLPRQNSDLSISSRSSSPAPGAVAPVGRGPPRKSSNLSPLSRPFVPMQNRPRSESNLSIMSRSSSPTPECVVPIGTPYSDFRLSNLSRPTTPLSLTLPAPGTTRERSNLSIWGRSSSPAPGPLTPTGTPCKSPNVSNLSRPPSPALLAPIGTPRNESNLSKLSRSSSPDVVAPLAPIGTQRQPSHLATPSSPRPASPAPGLASLPHIWSPRPNTPTSSFPFEKPRQHPTVRQPRISLDLVEMRDRARVHVEKFRTLFRVLRHHKKVPSTLLLHYDYEDIRGAELLAQDVYSEFLCVVHGIDWLGRGVNHDDQFQTKREDIRQAWASGMGCLESYLENEGYVDLAKAAEAMGVGKEWADGLRIEEIEKEAAPALDSRITQWHAMQRQKVKEMAEEAKLHVEGTRARFNREALKPEKEHGGEEGTKEKAKVDADEQRKAKGVLNLQSETYEWLQMQHVSG